MVLHVSGTWTNEIHSNTKEGCGFQGLGEDNEESEFNKDRISVLQDQKRSGMGGDDGCTT